MVKSKGQEARETINSVIKEVARVVTEMAGIQLGPKQFSMIENRLKTRMLRLDVETFENYLSYLNKHKEAESQALLSLITTHHTYFFREFSHFEFLLNRALPRITEAAKARGEKTIRVLSAACSKGHEVYSLAMFFDFHLKAIDPQFKFEIWGTDIDPESVKYAQNGVYKAEELKQSPAMYLAQHWTRGQGNVRDFSKIRPELKSHCHFSVANLLSYDSFLQQKKFDVIFCRNVFIYFNPSQITSATQSLLKGLDPQGFLILGVSESLNGLNLNVDLIGPSSYQHKVQKSHLNLKTSSALSSGKSSPTVIAPAPLPIPAEVTPKILNVLCVDDSPSIHALLKKILIKEEGFQIGASAKNGREALDILKSKKFDIITLDLHMPELDGVGFLSEFKDKETPVVILSSINRDDTSIAQKAIALGASDYVEKPSLENLAQAGNEIRAKLKMVVSTKKSTTTQLVTKAATPQSGKAKVLIVDDSSTIRSLLTKILNQDPRFEIVGMAEKPSQVEELIKKNKPDVITLDIHMPEMDGVTLLKKIHPIYKIPCVMISSISREEGTYVLDALAHGAVDYIQKPQMSDLSDSAKQICDRVAIAAKAKVQTKFRSTRRSPSSVQFENLESLILIGASTGGTEAIRVVLEGLPKQIPPILVVQHIPPVFSSAFAQRLNEILPFEVKEAQNGDEVKSNRVLIAPGGKQMGVRIESKKLCVFVNDDPPVNRHKPSVDYLFNCVNQLSLPQLTATILTGMGNDGAQGLKKLRDRGCRTIAQNEDTCVVFGMPKEAIAMGAAEHILPLEQIADKIVQLTQKSASNKSGVKKVS